MPHQHGQGPAPQGPQPLPGVDAIIAVGSGKGGVGKTTLSVNLAVALAKMGHKVGLLDADVYGPNVPLMLGVNDQPRMVGENRIEPIEAFGLKVISVGFLNPGDKPIIWRGPMLHQIVRQFLGLVEWGQLDYLIVDLPPGTGDIALSLVQTVPLTGAVVVSTPSDVSLQDARKAIEMFRQMKVDVVGVVENMSYFVCPHCQHEVDIFSRGGAEKMAAAVWGVVPGQHRTRPGSPQVRRRRQAGGARRRELAARQVDLRIRAESSSARRGDQGQRAGQRDSDPVVIRAYNLVILSGAFGREGPMQLAAECTDPSRKTAAQDGKVAFESRQLPSCLRLAILQNQLRHHLPDRRAVLEAVPEPPPTIQTFSIAGCRSIMKWLSGVCSYWQTRVSISGASFRAGKRKPTYSRMSLRVSGLTTRSPSVGSNAGPRVSSAILNPRRSLPGMP